ncbi:thioesterase [Xenorhabdus nematophila]|uniref:Thioesterase involved in xenocoumacin synthesis n=1 Tax=Xenorhabdus nematophila (strain ATCC 19061 / DSM 3370 / CCUG 14189 / LMG 1036 / NCIMB 9965 / AN6) TaxID=406817 RepID=D3VCB0_XENNA|nr:alpha/beta fold hydrolase [Xenorhabdus nematophila]CEF32203.1 Thioesterase involved in xenocoumacin synthesis [Xenorhabdus nematophila str. Websteri]AYA40612.1 thioesterase [Xenorhabdus nematophila]MBA0019352.1 thioesterase [Xenorhabdus nematophila]MCB4424186.1 alpha/beta fold hydrolase [Xenorhabdus nematophila]QNJ38251.1 thioesterase [Xenorhabdus nematophila]
MLDKINLNEPVNAKLRLYLFHHAGGSHMLYRTWQRELPDWIEFIAIELPGRGLSFGETCLESIEEIIDKLLPVIKTDKPFAFFGHSMGALIAYELALKLQTRCIHPLWIGLSAFKPAHIKKKELVKRYMMEDEPFLDYLKTLGDTKELTEDKQALQIMLAIIRKDFKVIDNCVMSESQINNKTAVSLFYAKDDPEVTYEMMKEWSRYILGQCTIYGFQGGHFYLQKYKNDVIKKIESEINEII